MQRLEHRACFGGWQQVWQHRASRVNCDMRFGLYVPPTALRGEPCPVVYWLSGLTCTEQNFITKAGAQQYAAQHGLILVAPDTSPRGPGVADDPADDLGQGAGFYLNATQAPWAAHFHMESYIIDELPQTVAAALADQGWRTSGRQGVSGHSMGGHGALTLALRHPGHYQSVSALAPIVAPSQVPWGQKAFAAYLGDDPDAWRAHDAVALIESAATRERLPLLVDQGAADPFLATQLRPELLQAACEHTGHPLRLRLQPDYDHSYYFVASFIGEHLAHHAGALRS